VTKTVVNQTENTVAGDMAGGNINKTVYNFQPTPLRELADKFRLECSHDQHLSEFIQNLKHYIDVAPQSPSRDLEAKLIAGGREDLLNPALLSKERFTKKLLKMQFSQQAQEIFAHTLGKIHTFFIYNVKPKMMAGMPRHEVDSIIYSELLEKIYNDIGSCPLDIDMTDIQGMVYFLAGNCHISWD
jgi:hypothetical protein